MADSSGKKFVSLRNEEYGVYACVNLDTNQQLLTSSGRGLTPNSTYTGGYHTPDLTMSEFLMIYVTHTFLQLLTCMHAV